MVDVDPQDGAQQVVDRLAGQVGVGAAGAVARGDVEIAVVAEGKVAAVVAVGGPLDDHEPASLGRYVASPCGRPCNARPASSSDRLERAIHADVDVAVALVVGMEGDADGEAVDLEQGLGPAGVLVVVDGEQPAGPGPEIEVLKNEQAVGARLGGQAQGLLDRQLGKGPHDLVGRRRVGRPDHARVVPGDAPVQAEGLFGGRRPRRRRTGERRQWTRSDRTVRASRRVESGQVGDELILGRSRRGWKRARGVAT